ncbi:hypothetical protein [Methylomagnum ishizawai]|uniref:hypothetical protein n=1 Tax=Methylomagnum ishizawai TaxID=1760988 RepID=UPI001C3390FC|nr:hypothetical protein [Methylomagnum ishizawai]BBL74840.1 hypothetical protein MishRS11D_19380 [Methylomagnum ishizawai]
MNPPVRAALIGALLAFAATAHAEEGTWEPSTLSPATLDKVQASLKVYQQCVNDETRAHLNDKMDSRQVADLILRNCEDKLNGIKTAFDAEKVPAPISERYMRSKRSMAAQQILRVVMAHQAMQSTQAAQ